MVVEDDVDRTYNAASHGPAPYPWESCYRDSVLARNVKRHRRGLPCSVTMIGKWENTGTTRDNPERLAGIEPSADDIWRVKGSSPLCHNGSNEPQGRFVPTILRRDPGENRNFSLPQFQFLCRSWTENKYFKNSVTVYVSWSINYNFYGYVETKQTKLTNILPIVDSDAGPNIACRDRPPKLGRRQDSIWPSSKHTKCKEGSVDTPRDNQTCSTAWFLWCWHFVLCVQIVAAKMIVDADFCDTFVQTIRPNDEPIEQEVKKLLSILCCGSRVKRCALRQ